MSDQVTETAVPLVKRTWFKWAVAIAIVALLAGLAVVVWRRPKVNAEARAKAQQLHDLATARGISVPSVKALAEIYGVDGGATAKTAGSDIARALLALNVARSGEVNQRSAIIDPKLLLFEWLVLKVYRPEAAAKYQKFIDGLKLENTLGQ